MKIHWIMLQLPRFDERDEYIEAIALGRVALRGHQALDLPKRAAVVTLGLD